jgi:hypothetical protein
MTRIYVCGVAHLQVRCSSLGVKVWHIADKGCGVAHLQVRRNSLRVMILGHNS